jgi:MFS family permease
MGTILAVAAVPQMLLTPIGGVICDRYSKRKILAGMNILTSILITVFLMVFSQLNVIIAVMLMLMILLSFESFISPAAEATIPFIVPTEDLVKANSVSFIMTIFSMVGAPMFGGVIISQWGLIPVLIVSIILYTIASILKHFVVVPPLDKTPDGGLLKTIVADLKEAVIYVTMKNRSLGKVLLILGLFGVIFVPIVAVAFPVLVMTYFDIGEGMLGLTRGLIALGGVFSTVIIGALGSKANISKTNLLLRIASLAFIPAALAFWWSTSSIFTLIVLLASFFLILAFTSANGILCYAYIGEQSPAHLVGKIFALTSCFSTIGIALGNFLYGLLFEYFAASHWWALMILATASMIYSITTRFQD